MGNSPNIDTEPDRERAGVEIGTDADADADEEAGEEGTDKDADADPDVGVDSEASALTASEHVRAARIVA